MEEKQWNEVVQYQKKMFEKRNPLHELIPATDLTND